MTGKVFNVGLPFVDEDVKPGLWRKADDGGVAEEVEEFIFLDLDVDNSQQMQQGGEHVDAADGVVEPLMPDLVEDSSDDEDDGEGPGGGDDDQWGPEDDAVEEQHVDQPLPVEYSFSRMGIR